MITHATISRPSRYAVTSLLLATLLAAAAHTSAAGQTTIRFFSTLARNNTVPAECLQAKALVLPLLESYPHPAAWTWIIACDEAAWHRIEFLRGLQNTAGTILAGTDRAARVTYLRGTLLLNPLSLAFEQRPAYVVAHELGHILLNTADENKAQHWADAALRELARIPRIPAQALAAASALPAPGQPKPAPPSSPPLTATCSASIQTHCIETVVALSSPPE